ASLVSGDSDPGAARRAHEERAIPVSLLAAACDGGADARFGIPSFRDDGEGRRVPARTSVAVPVRYRPLVLDRVFGGALDAPSRRVLRPVSAGHERRARLFDD